MGKGVMTYAPQVGEPGMCHLAQVFGPQGTSICSIDATGDPSVATDWAILFSASVSMRLALEECGEVLDLVREKMGLPGPGDGADRKADSTDTYGVIPAIESASEALRLAREGVRYDS